MYLLDTNLFLEILLGQERAEETQRFLQQAPREQLLVSDFSLYSKVFTPFVGEYPMLLYAWCKISS
jgi:predicted nucleic acid-binding protein